VGGAVVAWLNSADIFQSLDIVIGDAEIEARIYNMLLQVERAGVPALGVLWLLGIGAILIARALLLMLVGLIGGMFASRPRAPSPPSPPAGSGPWKRPPPAPPPDRSPPSADGNAPVVDRAGRPAERRDTVVLKRPRGHMDRR
jgi:hypothetical protein